MFFFSVHLIKSLLGPPHHSPSLKQFIYLLEAPSEAALVVQPWVDAVRYSFITDHDCSVLAQPLNPPYLFRAEMQELSNQSEMLRGPRKKMKSEIKFTTSGHLRL